MSKMLATIDQDESALWAAYAADRGNQVLRNRLVEHYLPLADAAANRLIRRLPNCYDADSIRQEVRLALVGLVKSFDPFRQKKNRRLRGQAIGRHWPRLSARRVPGPAPSHAAPGRL